MNIAANQPIYPQPTAHMPYPNGAIIQSPIQQTASLVRDPFFCSIRLFLNMYFLIFP